MAVDEPVAGNEPSPEEAPERGPADAPDPGSERAPAPSPAEPADPWPAGPPRHFLTLDVLGPAGLRAVLDLAHRAKRDPAALRGQLAGGQIGLLFDKPSTRTRVSFEAAAWRLGILPIALRPDELQLGRGEPIPDTARVLSRYLEALVVRTFAQARLDELAAGASIPVLNALTDEHHPCQALADLMTLEEAWGSLAGATVAYVGDGNNVCHSLVQAAALAGFTLRVASPPGYAPDPAIVGAARRTAALTRSGESGRPSVAGKTSPCSCQAWPAWSFRRATTAFCRLSSRTPSSPTRTARRPARVLGSVSTHSPLIRWPDRTTLIRPASRSTSAQRRAVISPNRSPVARPRPTRGA